MCQIVHKGNKKAEKHLKIFNTISYQGIPNQTILRISLIPVIMTKINNTDDNSCCRMWKKGNPQPLLMGVQTSTTSMKINMAFPQKSGNKS